VRRVIYWQRGAGKPTAYPRMETHAIFSDMVCHGLPARDELGSTVASVDSEL
jgi:hypothetical protein